MAYRAEKSLHHVAMVAQYLDLNKPWSRKYGDNIDKYDFPVRDCTQEQNGSPNFSSAVRQGKWPFLSRKIVEIEKFCHHGNVTSHFSSLLRLHKIQRVPGGSENIEVLWHTLCSNIAKKIIRLTGVFILWFRCSEVPLYRLSSVPLAYSMSNIHYIFAIIITVTTVFLSIIIIIIIINY